MSDPQTTRLKHRDVVEIVLQGFVETDEEGPGGVDVAFYDAYGHRHRMALKRKWIKETRADGK